MSRTFVSAATAAAVAFAVSVSVAPAASADTAIAGSYNPVPNTRVLDTRSGIGAPRAKVAPGATLTFTAAPGLRSPVSAVVLNVTEINPTAGGYLTVFAAGIPRPRVSNLNFDAGQIVPNLVVVRVGAAGRVSIYNGSPGTVDLLADISGFFAGGSPSQSGTLVTTRAPIRILDTRTGTGARKVRVNGFSTTRFRVAGTAGIPANVSAVVMNVIAVKPSGAGYLTAYQTNAPRPFTSTVNFYPRQNRANLALLALGSDGTVSIYNGSGGSVDLVADVTGYFLGGTPTVDGAFVYGVSYRALDTRLKPGRPLPALVTGRVRIFPVVAGQPNPFVYFKAVSLTVTAVNPGAAGYLTAWEGTTARPSVSTTNFVRTRNAAGSGIVPVAPDGTISIYNGSSSGVDLVVDVTGFFYNMPRTPAVTGRFPASTPRSQIASAFALLKHFKASSAPVRLVASQH